MSWPGLRRRRRAAARRRRRHLHTLQAPTGSVAARGPRGVCGPRGSRGPRGRADASRPGGPEPWRGLRARWPADRPRAVYIQYVIASRGTGVRTGQAHRAVETEEKGVGGDWGGEARPGDAGLGASARVSACPGLDAAVRVRRGVARGTACRRRDLRRVASQARHRPPHEVENRGTGGTGSGGRIGLSACLAAPRREGAIKSTV